MTDTLALMSDDEWKEIAKKVSGKFEGLMKTLFRQKGAHLDISILSTDKAQDFINTHTAILDSTFQKVEMSDLMRQRLSRSNYVFSGMKTFHELNEAFPSLLDENGDRKTFERFLNDVQSIDETYNRNYLRAEYNFVHQSAQMAAKWERFAEDGDRYYLQYRTAGDDKVRPEHAALNRVTLPMSDPFWETYYPPNGWNCFTSYTPVLTANGWKRIASIKKGDLVVGGSGNLRVVTATLARPFKGDLVTIVTKGAKATCTPNHRFCTRRGWVAAEDLHKGDIIIQVGEQSALHLLVHAVGNAYTILRYGLMACIRKGKAIAALAIYYKPKVRDKEVDHIPSEKLTLLELNAHCNEVTAHDFFALAHWCAQCAHPFWMKFAGGKRPLGRLLSYIRSEKKRGKLQLFRYATNETAVRLRLALAHMKTFGRKLTVRLGKPFGRFCTSGIVIDPLGSDSIAAMSDRDSQRIENTMHGSAVDSPMGSEPSEAPLFGGIPEFCGIEDIHAFDGFHSFFDFLRNTFLHNRYVLVEGKVTKKKRELTVFNLSISGDESYIVPIGIAHNCRCTVVQVLKWKYDKTNPKEAMDRGKEAMDGERFNIFRFNSGKQQKAVPDYNPYTIRRCNDCDVAKGKGLKLAFTPDNETCASCQLLQHCANDRTKSERTKERIHYVEKEMKPLLKHKEVLPAGDKEINVGFTQYGNKHLFSDTFGRSSILTKDDLATLDRVLHGAKFIESAGLLHERDDNIERFYYYEGEIRGQKIRLNVAKLVYRQPTGKKKTRYFLYSINDIK